MFRKNIFNYSIVVSSTLLCLLAIGQPRKKQKTCCNNFMLQYRAFFSENLDNMQQAIELGTHLDIKISYSRLELIALELFTHTNNNKNEMIPVCKHTFFFENEKPVLTRIKYLILNKITVTLEEVGENDPPWQNIAPTLAKLLLLEPTDPIAYADNPEQYKKDHSHEFDPVILYPKDFDNEITLMENWKLKKLEEQQGSVFNYIKNRELGLKQ